MNPIYVRNQHHDDISHPLRTNSAEFSDWIGFRLAVRESGRYSLLCSQSIVKLLTTYLLMIPQ